MAAVDTAPVLAVPVSADAVGLGSIKLTEGVVVSKEELGAIMAVNAQWPYPAEQDGWIMSHNAIRLDMSDFAEALDVLEKQVQKTPLEAWQVSNLQRWVPIFYHLVHEHHEHEEVIFFPWLETRVKLPPKMSADHKTLMALLDRTRDLATKLQTSDEQAVDAAAVAELKTTFTTMRQQMLEHLKEEDELGLPAMRKFFTRKEAAIVEAKIIKTITPQGMANFLRPLPNDAAKRKWMTETAKIPGIVQSLILMPATRKYDAQVQQLLEELKKGERMPPAPGCFGC